MNPLRYCKNAKCGAPYSDNPNRLLCPACRHMVSRGMVAGFVLATLLAIILSILGRR